MKYRKIICIIDPKAIIKTKNDKNEDAVEIALTQLVTNSVRNLCRLSTVGITC